MARRKLQEKRGLAFGIAVAIVKPTLLATTKQDWTGGEHIPAEGGCVIAANHLSHLDPLTFAHFVYDHGRLPRYLAKAEVFDIPVAGRLVHATGQIPVARLSAGAASAFAAAVEAVSAGNLVIVYPEGTITRDPDLWPMVGKTGAARIALATGCPVIPVAQWGVQELLAPYAKKVNLLPRKTMTMRAGPPVDLSAYDGRSLTPEVLRAATSDIMDAITAELEMVRQEKAPAVRFDPKAAGVREIGNPHEQAERERRRKRGHR
ncbi:lysophospholipid acyltransferase family protein [Nocardioides massiliensis]|uniref:1-acyl-sn-glycerol-3-phosphate acyltransferase n=1 Tax=Nocardioides massiliensis TaxID=1325935 RepID=A0ABT9NQ38_9ACTN|nr:lysophospholipid acyltransferase family protein [Nocardioides massiliensis]MDP9822544.1 1-acyl-sn-glycerol-3-phosphate acyltransferase [Nocardioides massiliensis]